MARIDTPPTAQTLLTHPIPGEMPHLETEMRVSRQYRLHVLHLPHETNPLFAKNLADALEWVRVLDYDALTVDIGGEHYLLSLAKES